MKVLKFGSAEGVPRVWTMEDLSAFYVENRSAFVLQASRLLKDSARAEEVVQDALIRVILATPELESESHALSYFRKTVENLCLDIFRLENRRPNLVLIDDAVSEIEAASTAQFVDHSEIIAAADDAAIIRQALSLLSPAERAALVMWEMEGRSTLEIARELGISDKTVRHTIARARKSFRRILSEHVIDADRGLTALDLLSSTYRKSLEVAKKSSKAALSIILVFFAFIGFNSLTPQSDFGQVSQEVTTSTPISNLSDSDQQSSNAGNSSSRSEKANSSTEFSSVKSPKPQSVENAKASTLKFPGLDKLGLPIGFTVTDNSGSLGSLSFFPKSATFSETGFGISWLVKTSEGASNVFLSQSLRQETAEPEYDVTLSFGMSGGWIPTNSRLVSADFERLVSGNYLLTAVIQVKSAVETTIVIPASASGQDLSVLPSRVVTRVVLNPSKTQVLAQAVQVIEKGTN